MTSELLIVESKTICQKQELVDHVKILLRSYLDIFYVAIYRVRLLIEISKQIGNQKDRLRCQDVWGFFQNNLIVSAVVVEIFSIFDKKSNSLIKQFQQELKKNKIDSVTVEIIKTWINKIKKYQNARHKLYAHKDLNPPRSFTVMYNDFLQLLDEFEEKLLFIDNKYIPDIPNYSYPRITSKLNLDTPILNQLIKLLSGETQA